MTIKKSMRKVFTIDNIVDVLNFAKEKIIEQVKENIPSIEKKFAVDYKVIEYIKSKTSDCKNGIVLWVLDRVIDGIPRITQFVYDLLKAKIENL